MSLSSTMVTSYEAPGFTSMLWVLKPTYEKRRVVPPLTTTSYLPSALVITPCRNASEGTTLTPMSGSPEASRTTPRTCMLFACCGRIEVVAS